MLKVIYKTKMENGKRYNFKIVEVEHKKEFDRLYLSFALADDEKEYVMVRKVLFLAKNDGTPNIYSLETIGEIVRSCLKAEPEKINAEILKDKILSATYTIKPDGYPDLVNFDYEIKEEKKEEKKEEITKANEWY